MTRKFTTTQAARLLGVSDQTISNWVDRGHLRAGRTAGGHRRIEAEDLVEFLRKQNLRIPPELGSSATTILIVDDDQSVAAWLSDIIKSRFPYTRVLVANDGYSAGEIVSSERPEVVLLDLYMPGMDGFEVCRRIKAKEGTRKARVIAVTAHHTADAEKAIREAGAETCLAKPLNPEELYAAMGKFLPASL